MIPNILALLSVGGFLTCLLILRSIVFRALDHDLERQKRKDDEHIRTIAEAAVEKSPTLEKTVRRVERLEAGHLRK